MTRATVVHALLGSGTTPSCRAKACHDSRPAITPSGTPTASAAIVVASDWARTDQQTWPGRKPSARATARSRRRDRTDAHDMTPSPSAPTTASEAPTTTGTERVAAASMISGGRTARW